MHGYNAVVSSTQKHDNALYRGINQVNQDNKLDQSKTTSKSPSMKLFFKKLSAIWQHLDLIIFMSMTFYGLTLKSMKISSDSPWAMSTAVIICFSPTRCKPSMHSLIQIYRFQPSIVYRPVNSSVTTGASNSEWLTKLVSCQHSWFSTFGHVGHDQN